MLNPNINKRWDIEKSLNHPSLQMNECHDKELINIVITYISKFVKIQSNLQELKEKERKGKEREKKRKENKKEQEQEKKEKKRKNKEEESDIQSEHQPLTKRRNKNKEVIEVQIEPEDIVIDSEKDEAQEKTPSMWRQLQNLQQSIQQNYGQLSL